MVTRYYIGAPVVRGTIEGYARRFDLAEVELKGGKGSPAVKALRRWRKNVPASFQFAVVAPPSLSSLDASKREHDVALVQAAADALQARCIVIRTPPDVRPSASTQRALISIFEAFPRDATHVVWEPSGLWEVEEAAAFAKSRRVVVSVDPTQEKVPSGAFVYLRVRGLGQAHGLSEHALSELVKKLSQRREVFIILDTAKPATDRKRWLSVFESRLEESGKEGRLIRPRNGLTVIDDEQ